MNIDPRLHQYCRREPYPLLFATVSGAHLYPSEETRAALQDLLVRVRLKGR